MSIAEGRVSGDVALLRRYFSTTRDFPELRNPHVEPPVSDAVRARAKPSAVLIGVVDEPGNPRVLVTRRHRNIRFAGHICFPGGRVDPSDESAIATALRESEEEIALDPAEVDVLGALGDYYTQAGYRITPVVGLVSTNVTLSANPSEVEAIYRISLADMLRSQSYRLRHRTPTRGHYSYEEKDIRIAGPTVSLMIGLYESLLAFQASTISAK